jgi:hypothetical protein
MSARSRQLATHVRGLSDDDLNDLLVDLPAIASPPWPTPLWPTQSSRPG